ncbi:MAG: penicillin-binding protein 1C, partial [Dokdonella sp.]
GLLRLRVDTDSGERLSAGCTHAHVAEREIARWPSLAYPWLDAATRRASRVPSLANDCPADGLDQIQTLHIDGIADHASIAKPPNSDKPLQLRLRALGAQGTVSWLLNARLTATSNGSQPVELTFPDPGTQTITALTDRGVYQQIEIRVLR